MLDKKYCLLCILLEIQRKKTKRQKKNDHSKQVSVPTNPTDRIINHYGWVSGPTTWMCWEPQAGVWMCETSSRSQRGQQASWTLHSAKVPETFSAILENISACTANRHAKQKFNLIMSCTPIFFFFSVWLTDQAVIHSWFIALFFPMECSVQWPPVISY